MKTLRLDALLLQGILDIDLVTWEEHSKNFGYISYSTRVEILKNILNIDARYAKDGKFNPIALIIG
jgi:hypothetical protein